MFISNKKMKMQNEDYEGIKYNYRIYFVDGNLSCGKTFVLEEINKKNPDSKF